MENGETVAEAALRETAEEANARVALDAIYTVLSVPHINQVHVIFRAALLDLDFSAGAESLEVALFHAEEIPWPQIAFRSIALTLRHFLADRQAGRFGFHVGNISPPEKDRP
jgi:8-oxo-dGTP pyrophosphatase MutT (NUDIX family)